MKRKDGMLTVSELIEQLQQMPPDAIVTTEGCDCVGAANSAAIDDDGIVTIIRHADYRHGGCPDDDCLVTPSAPAK